MLKVCLWLSNTRKIAWHSEHLYNAFDEKLGELRLLIIMPKTKLNNYTHILFTYSVTTVEFL